MEGSILVTKVYLVFGKNYVSVSGSEGGEF